LLAGHRQRQALEASLRLDLLAFDDSPEGELMRRYRLAKGREFHRAIDAVLKLRKAVPSPDGGGGAPPIDAGPDRAADASTAVEDAIGPEEIPIAGPEPVNGVAPPKAIAVGPPGGVAPSSLPSTSPVPAPDPVQAGETHPDPSRDSEPASETNPTAAQATTAAPIPAAGEPIRPDRAGAEPGGRPSTDGGRSTMDDELRTEGPWQSGSEPVYNQSDPVRRLPGEPRGRLPADRPCA
jgi:hypothetical protein